MVSARVGAGTWRGRSDRPTEPVPVRLDGADREARQEGPTDGLYTLKSSGLGVVAPGSTRRSRRRRPRWDREHGLALHGAGDAADRGVRVADVAGSAWASRRIDRAGMTACHSAAKLASGSPLAAVLRT
jgi:hypothetical protein